MQVHQIRLNQGETALDVIVEMGGNDNVVGAGGVVHPEPGTAAIAGHQVGEELCTHSVREWAASRARSVSRNAP